MKKFYVLWAFLITMPSLLAQAPEKLSYQSVIRDANNTLVQNQQVGIRISILQGSINGTEVFAETHTTSTNDNGLVSIEIGAGTILSGSLQSINWGANEHFIRTQTDPNGGINYSIDGVSQLLTVPYAFYADSAGSSFSGDYQDLVNTPVNLSDFTNDQGFIANEVDGDPSNELQVLTISNDTLFLSNGGFAVLPASFDGQYSSLTGAPTNVSSFNNDTGYIITELDGDSTNELQSLNLSGDSITISNGNSVDLSHFVGPQIIGFIDVNATYDVTLNNVPHGWRYTPGFTSGDTLQLYFTVQDTTEVFEVNLTQRINTVGGNADEITSGFALVDASGSVITQYHLEGKVDIGGNISSLMGSSNTFISGLSSGNYSIRAMNFVSGITNRRYSNERQLILIKY